MSVSSISSNNDQTYQLNQTSSRRQQRRQDFQELSDDLKSGDLNGAQQAFSALQQLFSDSSANGQTQTDQKVTGTNSVATDISALGQALQSGDLKTSQTDFAQLQNDIQSIGQGHHHHHHKVSSTSQDASTAGSSSSQDELSQLLANLTSQSSSTAGSSSSSASIQQLMSLLNTIQGSSGKNIDASSLQSLLGSIVNIST